MTFNDLCSLIAEKEGLKKEVSIGNIREIAKIMLIEEAKMSHGELGKLLSKYE